LILAFGFSGSVELLFNVIPPAVLGVMLFLAGTQLALGSANSRQSTVERFMTLATAGFAIWNVGLAFIAGLLLGALAKRGWLRL
jgi:hypothetical protein